VAATQAIGTTVIRDAAELRVKETDRIEGVVSQLRRLGAQIEGRPDGMVIEGPSRLSGAAVAGGGDHRVTMSLLVAGLLAHGSTTVAGAEFIDDSYPGFVETLCRLGQLEVEVHT
jgi:3-phosphoshikimate 1-carboxyvinyltransferase